MAKTIEQLQREIAEQRTRIAKEKNISKKIKLKNELSRELFQLKNQKLIGAGAKFKRLSRRFGKGLLKAGQTAAPVIKKQARLIRDQKLRDDAIARQSKKGKLTTKTVEKFIPIKSKGKKTVFKKVRVKIKVPKKVVKKSQSNLGIFGNLDF